MMRKYGISYDDNGSNEDHEEYQPLSPESQGRAEPQKSSNGLPLVKFGSFYLNFLAILKTIMTSVNL